MVRQPLSPDDRARGALLGEMLRAARGDRSMVDVAAAAGISVETLRKIERGRVPTPAFFTVAAIAGAVGVSLEQLLTSTEPAEQGRLSA
ncbi:helix-turn-helix domain-containing protein [Actinokineospora enzanensis]|uniref:helix-turn-helix domain-containing protein n=1 Tax=Actinokineospora enzanensis TaxID=155975 RepID=UPI000365E322|nr:helix-turn-helix transcriptional regulator [Actinokineospora enzanensis]